VKEADELATWLDTRVKRLERNEDLAERAAQAPKSARAERSSAELLLRFLLDRDLAHLAPKASLARIEERLAPLLAIKPEKRAIAAVIEFLESDDAIDEVFAEDDVLRAIIVEFLD